MLGRPSVQTAASHGIACLRSRRRDAAISSGRTPVPGPDPTRNSQSNPVNGLLLFPEMDAMSSPKLPHPPSLMGKNELKYLRRSYQSPLLTLVTTRTYSAGVTSKPVDLTVNSFGKICYHTAADVSKQTAIIALLAIDR